MQLKVTLTYACGVVSRSRLAAWTSSLTGASDPEPDAYWRRFM